MTTISFCIALTFASPFLLGSSSSAADAATPDRATTTTIEVWGKVERPVPTKRVLPKMPDTGRADIRGGLAIVEVWIRADGSVAQAKSVKRMPFGMDEAAVAAVREWRFNPGKVNGARVPVVQNVAVNFTP